MHKASQESLIADLEVSWLALKKAVLTEPPSLTGQPGASQGKKIGHRGVDASGETTYKKYSLCNEPLIELSNPGASGSLFYVTSDDEFIIKTVMHKEAEFLQKLLPGYYMNLNQNPRTLLPKFYGLYCVQSGGKNIRVVVMNNILPRVVKMHLKYDLKGSTYKRRASKKEKDKSSPTYKDLDFMQDMPEGIMLDADTFNALVKTLQRDCLVTVNGKGERLLLHVGIIDILQSYRLIKKLEHTWKALVHDGDTVSVHRPSFYAERFFKFMTNTVFRKSSCAKVNHDRGEGKNTNLSLW
ncbi:hypothetical protein E2320_022056 [Naja naja]|nr:hypothetical protein E2320_022056 [Naja naja]